MQKILIQWYDKNKKNMPWRVNTNPYRIWISEVMLQQTQVSTVIPYYKKWMEKFPKIEKVAAADIDEILKLWEGLGYYSRAQNIKKACDIIMNQFNGKIENVSNLNELPGIGDYIASAINSIAFSEPHPVIDGNVKRVASRLWEMKIINTADIKKLKTILDLEISKERPGCFNQAIMDLGREICKPQKPHCEKCPISQFCQSLQNNTIAKYPYKLKKKKVPIVDVVVAYIQNHKKDFIITKRPANKMLGGLWELPGGKRESGESFKSALIREIREELNIDIQISGKIGEIEHTYSHMKINLHAYTCSMIEKKATIKVTEAQDLKWIQFKNIGQYSFPKANHKLFQKMRELYD